MDVSKFLRKMLSFELCREIMKIEKSQNNLSEIRHFKLLHRIFQAILYFSFSNLYEKAGIEPCYTYAIENSRFFLLPEFYFKGTDNSSDSRERVGTLFLPLYPIHPGHKHSNIYFVTFHMRWLSRKTAFQWD